MFGINWQQTVQTFIRAVLTSLMAAVLVTGLVGCSDRFTQFPGLGQSKEAAPSEISKISEVSPPVTIQKLRQTLDKYQPQVAILSPQTEEILRDNSLNVQLEVRDLPIFKSNLGLGPHLEVILDNQPYTKIYDLNEPLIISDLEPGTHTLRVFACRPWDESFKNEGAYTQRTFHIFTKTASNNPDPDKPLLTYNSPRDSYGAEPILLDFFLSNAPLHFVAQENPEDEIVDWRIRITINGTSFTSDRWQPIYLKGFKPGKNWVQLEYLDELGNPLNNVYNNTARLLTYEPEGQDPLSKLVRGEIAIADLLAIVDPNYIPPQPSEPETVTEPEALPITPPTIEVEEISPTPPPLEIEEEEEAQLEAPVVEPFEEDEDIPVVEPSTVEPILEEKQELEENAPVIESSGEEEEIPVVETFPELEETLAAEPVLEMEEGEIEETPTAEAVIEIEEQEIEQTPTAEAVIEIEEQKAPTAEAVIEIEEQEAPTIEPTSVIPTPEVESELALPPATEESETTTKVDYKEFLDRLLRRFKGIGNGTVNP